MSRINWVRLILGGVIAAIIAFLTDGLFHENVVSADWKAVYTNLGISEPQHSGLGVLYFAVFDLGRGLVSSSAGSGFRSYSTAKRRSRP